MPNLPAPVAELILKLMARRREDRFTSAEETTHALESLGVGPSTPAIPKAASSGTLPLGAVPALRQQRPNGARVVAVLPVLNLGPPDDAYLVENVNEDVIDLLSVVPGLLVRPRGDTARYDDSKRDARDIGRTLGADVVVDASLRRIGETMRAAFRLISVEDGFQLWARRFDRPPAQVLSIADDAAHAIARALTAELGQSKPRAATDPEAEDLFLRGRFLMGRGWHEAVRDAVELLARAHDRAPEDARIMGTYALALARVYGMELFGQKTTEQLRGYGVESFGREAADKARALAARVNELDPAQPEAKTALALIHLQNQEGDSAVRYLRAALAGAPNSIDALDWLGRVMGEVGRVDDAIALWQRASAIDPDALQPRHQIARLRSMTGDHVGMMEALGPMPSHPGDAAPWFATQARGAMWRRDIEESRRLAALLPTMTIPPSARIALEHMLKVHLGNLPELDDRAYLDRMLPVDTSRPPRRASFNGQLRAEMFAYAGKLPETLEALRSADGNGIIDILWLDRCPLFDPLRSHPDFQTIHGRVALRARRVADAIDARSSTLGA